LILREFRVSDYRLQVTGCRNIIAPFQKRQAIGISNTQKLKRKLVDNLKMNFYGFGI
jgi:hypothetical protein